MPIYNQHYNIQQVGGGIPQPFPQGLQAAGPILPVQVEIPTALAAQLQQAGQPIPPPVPGLALIDTGASLSAVDVTVVQTLGVQPVGIANVGGVTGAGQQPTYPGRFTFPGTGLPSIDFSLLLGANLGGLTVPGMPGQLIALLGREILQRFILIYNGPAAMFSLAF